MKRKIILFGAFLSTFILILTPSIGCVNINIQNEKNLNIKNINIDDVIKKIKRILNSDCNCQKPTDYDNIGEWINYYLCWVLLLICGIFGTPLLILMEMEGIIARALTNILVLILIGCLGVAELLSCFWLIY